MKKGLLLILALIVSLLVNARMEQNDSMQIQRVKEEQILSQRDSLLLALCNKLDDIDFHICRLNRYKIYKTENLYNVLKLDTKTGRIEQVQWSLDEDNEGSLTINGEDLSLRETGCGTFELYPTQNIYQFILLDKVTGRTWHVQWGLEDGKRWIRRIYGIDK